MNKKMIAPGVSGLILALAACGSQTYEYKISGAVVEQRLDYEDCPGEDIAMDAVAFVAGSGGSSGGRSSSRSGGSGKSSKKTEKKADSNSSSGGSGATGSSAPAKENKKKSSVNKGVKLSKKPEKAERLKGGKIPKVTHVLKPKGCETEYEIFVRDSHGDLYEQDVRRADYENCEQVRLKTRLFPKCTKG